MNLRSYGFVALLTVTALGIFALSPWETLLLLPIGQITGLAAFVLLAVLAEALALGIHVGSSRAKSSISFVPLLACVLYFPTVAAIGAAAIMHVVGDAVIHRHKLWVICFNASQVVIAAYVSSIVYLLLGGSIWPDYGIGIFAFVAMMAVYLTANVLMISGLFSLRQGTSFVAVARNAIGPRAGNLLYGFLASPIAVLLAIVYDRLYIGGLALMVLPLLLVRYSYLAQLKLQQANQDLLKVLVKTIETRDPYTSGHSLRVSHLARIIAEDMGMPRRRLEEVETAGLLHDIGKIDTIYSEIIRKPHELTDHERNVIRTHAVKGAELLESLTSLNAAMIAGVRHHHERYDGTGYPDGLKGEAIPLYARIIMICDSVDAMLSDRPYRLALPVEKVESELLRCSGAQFDPEIAQTIIRQGTLQRAAELVRQHSAVPAPEAALAGVD